MGVGDVWEAGGDRKWDSQGGRKWEKKGKLLNLAQYFAIKKVQKGGSQQKGIWKPPPPPPEMAVHSLIAQFQVPQDCRRTFLQG